MNTRRATKFVELKSTLENEKGFVLAGLCGDPRCEEAIAKETNASIRFIPFEDKPAGQCVMCQKPSKHTAFFVRSY